MALLDGPGLFRNTLIPSVGQGSPATAKRIPFSFTSTLRLLKSGRIQSIGNQFAKAQSEMDIKRELAVIEREARGQAIASQLGLSNIISAGTTIAQTIVTFDMPVINMAVNPQTIKWDQNKRIVKRDTMNGSTFFHFTNDSDQNNDILQMSFTGKTGNINTQANILDTIKTGSTLKLRIWHELYNLSREPMLLNKLNTGKDLPRGIRNEFFITYRTVLMPVQITLIGFFSKVLDFTETASDPFNRDYSFTFTVTRTSPSLDDISKMLNSSLSIEGQLKDVKSAETALEDEFVAF